MHRAASTRLPALLPALLPVLLPVLLLAAGVALAGCGDDRDEPRSERRTGGSASLGTDEATASATATTPPAPDLPDCAAVWVEGKRLPAGYAGCVDDAGEVSRDVRMCSIGDALATHDDRWYAVPGRVINHAVPDLERDQAYQSAVLACTG